VQRPLWKSPPSCPDIISNSGSDEAFAAVSSWLDECRKNHNGCGVSDIPTMPSRIIDVGKLEWMTPRGKGEDSQVARGMTVRLVDVRDDKAAEPLRDKPAPYAALSYCWAPAVIFPINALRRTLASIVTVFPYYRCPKRSGTPLRYAGDWGFVTFGSTRYASCRMISMTGGANPPRCVKPTRRQT